MSSAPSTATTVAISEIGQIDQPTAPGGFLRPIRRLGSWLGSAAMAAGRWIRDAIVWLFGLASLIVGLAFLAAAPLIQFYALGYLLEASSRVAQSGKLRDGFPSLRLAGRLGAAFLGIVLVSLPIWYIDDALADSLLIDPASRATRLLERLSLVLGIVTLAHIVLAVVRGGRLSYFARPISNLRWAIRELRTKSYFAQSWSSARTALAELRVKHYFWLGIRGFFGAMAWLFLPSAMLAAGPRHPLIGWLGGLLLIVVLFYVPFLQVRFAAENRWRAMFEVRAIRERFKHAPIAFLLTFLFTLVLALPLYLFKIEMVPRDALWLPALLFIVTIFPLKILAGWAYNRSIRRENRCHGVVTWSCRLLMLPVAMLYTGVVFLSQYTGWEGAAGIFAQHAFLLPVPF